MRYTINQLRRETVGDAKALAAVAAYLAGLESRLGNDARAMGAMLEAHRLDENSSYLASAAELAAKLGQLDFALRTWQQLCEAEPANDQYCTRREQTRARMDERTKVAP